MVKGRTYNLACPIARALDRVGDRWSLLIIRDLHAGPARFSDLQQGLTGIAANLLANRLSAMTADNLVNKKDGKHGTKLYQLTELGRKTSDLLFELAKLGTQFEPKGDVNSRENIRAIAVILGTACKLALAPHHDLVATFNVDDEQLTLIVKFGSVDVFSHTVLSPDLELNTNHDAILKFLETKMTFECFAAEHCKITVHTIGKEYEFMALMMAAQSHLQG